MMTALDLINEFLDIREEEKEIWKVQNDVEADWCLDKIRESKAEYNRFEMVAKEKVFQIEMALKREREKMERETGFFEGKLREYFEKIKASAKDAKTQKSYKLPSGVLKLKKAAITLGYDKDKLLEYAEENGSMDDYIKTVKEFKWAEFKKTLEIREDIKTKERSIVNKETGEIFNIEGLGIEEKPEIFSVEV